MKLSTQSSDGTSFNHITVRTTPNKLIAALGKPQYDYNEGDDKVNLEWTVETEAGDVATIYDWKEGREIRMDETIEFHIGARSESKARQAKSELNSLLAK